jgi:benzoyl-CoA reductase/2-hydroxyglutaryl-CoA dehydratase subunit BcrC/BadD/HgdB
MEVVRRSPAASIIRLEQKVELMVTKDEFREELNKLEKRLEDKIEKQGERIEKQGERIGGLEGAVTGVKFTQKLLISLYLSILGIVGAMFVKMFFFQ